MERTVFHTYTFLDGNQDTWQINFVDKGVQIFYHGPKYFMPSFFKEKELIMELNGDLDILDLFIPKPGVVPESDDLFDLLTSIYFHGELDLTGISNSPTKITLL